MAISESPDLLDERAQQFRTEAENFNEVVGRMESLKNTLEWQGNAATKFDSVFTELKPGFQKVNEVINELATALNTAAKNFREADQA